MAVNSLVITSGLSGFMDSSVLCECVGELFGLLGIQFLKDLLKEIQQM